jgi:chaperone modulatory protein CbpM
MISESELVATIGPLDTETLVRWIDLGWVRPTDARDPRLFDAADVARVHLICELHYELHIEEDSLSVVLSLMDQLYATRRSLSALATAVAAQPEDVRARISALARSKLSID